jgi:hypothetical protein
MLEENQISVGSSDIESHVLSKAAPHSGVMRRLAGVLVSPGEAFRDIKRAPTWLVPLIIATAAVLAGNIFFEQYARPDLDRLVRERIYQHDVSNSRSTPPEQVDRQVAITKSIARYSPVFIIVLTPSAYVLLACLFSLAIKASGGRVAFKQSLSVTAWSAAATNVVAAIVFISVVLLMSRERLSGIDPSQSSDIVKTNLGALLSKDASPVIKSLAASFDLFTLWRLLLLWIGFNTALKQQKGETINVGLMLLLLWGAWITTKALTAYVLVG